MLPYMTVNDGIPRGSAITSTKIASRRMMVGLGRLWWFVLLVANYGR